MIAWEQRISRGRNVMRIALILTTVAAFLGHALFGCCWHHAHAAGDWGSKLRGVESANAGCCHEGCAHAHSSLADDSSHEHEAPAPNRVPHDCDEPACLFVTTVKAPLIDGPIVSWLPLVMDVAPPAVYAVSLAQLDEYGRVRRLGADCLRSHLALGVLRI